LGDTNVLDGRAEIVRPFNIWKRPIGDPGPYQSIDLLDKSEVHLPSA
jgi:hypothetical protein